MIAFHFAFDLVHFGWLRADPYNDFRWIASRTAILSSFLLVAGMGLALAQANGESALRFWKRIAKVAGAAALVSVGSWFVFGERFIWFGVLQAIAAISVLSRPQSAARIGQWPTPPALSPLGWLGRHSLLIYLVHQPLIFGAMTLVAMWLRPS